MGSAKLKCVDSYNDITPLFGWCEGRGDSISFEDDFQMPEEGNPDINERYESDSNDEYVLDDKRNTFDAIAVMQIKFEYYKLSYTFVLFYSLIAEFLFLLAYI